MKLDCGIQIARITSWLDDELSLAREGDRWVFSHDGATCLVSASPLDPRELAGITLERTLVSFDGDNEAVNEFHRIFTLRFISAGG